MTHRRCRYRVTRSAGLIESAGTDPYAADLIRRLRGLLAIVARPPVRVLDPVRRDDELLDRL